jgi:hypothetical protein
VEVIRHQDIGVEKKRVALTHGPKPFDEGLIVTFLRKIFCPSLPRATTC